MDQDNLERLRKKYGNAGGGDVFDPKFKAVADALFAGGSRRKPYAGIPTLLDAPFREWDPQAGPPPEDLDVALIGIPMDLGVTNRPGARFGPRALRAIERIGPYHYIHEIAPTISVRVADVGDVPMRSRYSLDQSIADIAAYMTRIHEAGIIPVSVGGDHSCTYPILKALGRDRPVGMVHIDAHCDTSGEYDGAKFHHGGPFRHAVLEGVLDPHRSIQIGIRGSSEIIWEFSEDSGMTVVHMPRFQEMGVDAVTRLAREVVGDGPVYITVDVDGIDPAYTPGTGTPEAGGLTPAECIRLLTGLAGLDVIGGDVMEVAPQYDANTTTALVGGQMLFEVLCLVAKAPRFAAPG